MIRSASACVLTRPNTSDLRTLAPAAPPTDTSHSPPSVATTPTSFTVASAQFRGQPLTAIFTLAGNSNPWNRFSIAIPRPVESFVPNRQKSVPTHVLQVRNAFVYAYPLGIPRSAHTSGSFSFGMPSRSIRWPPVILTIRTLCFFATSPILMSSSAEVIPP